MAIYIARRSTPHLHLREVSVRNTKEAVIKLTEQPGWEVSVIPPSLYRPRITEVELLSLAFPGAGMEWVKMG